MKGKAISLRLATAEDCERVWRWANDAQARANSFETDPIPWENHKDWFQRRLGDECSRLFIALDGDGDPVGQVRFEMSGEAAVISASVDPVRRGEGLGPQIIRTGAVALLAEGGVKVIHAYIKPGNDASVRAFRKAGFTASEDATIKGKRALHLTIVEM
jgi:L-amino acid N-acyltransferase YncA